MRGSTRYSDKHWQGLSKQDYSMDSPRGTIDGQDIPRSDSFITASSSSTTGPPYWKNASSLMTHAPGKQSNGWNTQKIRQIEWMFQLHDVAEGLLNKLYRLRKMLDLTDNSPYQYSDAFWQSGLFPNAPKLCVLVAKKFPEHPLKIQPEKVLLDLMTFREQALRVILDLSSTVVTLLPHQNPLILHAFMDLFCAFIRVNVFADKVPRKMLLQVYNLTHTILRAGRDYEYYHRLVQFVDSYDPPLKGLHEDLNFVSPRIGEILDAIGPTIFLSSDFERIRSEGFLSPYHPRYPEKLTNFAHPARAQDLTNIESYREWVLLGYMVCPSELLRVGGIDIAMAALRDTLALPLFRDEYIALHEEYQLYVLPKIAESRKSAKVGRAKQKEADLEYTLAKQVEKMICEAHDIAVTCSDNVHREHRIILKQELGRMILFFTDQPSLLAPNIQMAFAALSVTRSEILWYFSHIGLMLGKSKGNRIIPVDIDILDSTIGFLLNGLEKLGRLIHKYSAAIKGFALGYLNGAAQRIHYLYDCPGMVALDIDTELRQLFSSVMDCLENLPKMQTEKVVLGEIDLTLFRRDWLRLMMLISSSRSSVNVRHLEKATISTGKESIVSEGNMSYLWSRSVDAIDKQILQYSSLKVLCFYREHLNVVFRNTMFGPEGRPQNCCAWLSLASSFPDNAHYSVPDEASKLAKDAVSYAESLLESIMGGLGGLINILDSEEGFGSLENQLLPEQAALRLNQVAKSGLSSNKSIKHKLDYPLPGCESEPSNSGGIKMLEAAIQRLTSLCSELNEIEPLCVLNHVFVPREYLRDRVLNNFRSHLLHLILVNGELQRPSVIEAQIRRHITILHLIEKHMSMDLTRGIREILLKESFSGELRYMRSLKSDTVTGTPAVSTICEWYVEYIVKDSKGVGVSFMPLESCFRSAKPLGKISTEMVADLSELKAFVRIFGPYGVDKFDNCLREQLTILLNCISITLGSNKEALEALSANMHNRTDRDLALQNLMELETLMNFSLQVGHTLSLKWLLAKAASQVLEETTPLLFSLFVDFVKHAPLSVPEKQDVLRLKMLSCQIGATSDVDITLLQSILLDLGGAGDIWALLPYLYVACMTSTIWNSSTFSIQTGGFNNNVHCLARCINAIVVASEFVRFERKELQRQFFAQHDPNRSIELGGPEGDLSDAEGIGTVQTNIKAMMKTFVQCAATIALESWNETNRYPLVAKLIFLDQLCDLSSFLPRSTLETHVPRAILTSIYHLFYDSSSSNMSLLSQSRRYASGASITTSHSKGGTLGAEQADGSSDGSPLSSRHSIFSGAMKLSNQRRRTLLEAESSGESSHDTKASRRTTQHSGPLDYNGSRKVSFVDGPTTEKTRAPSPLRRFVLSRSGPVTYV
ncbi:hypothetical protein O6H91_05G056100 [Diphasiastrum complanatum]|uniref:Uncharacterized protein n=1 Tax=Diphasiastrum complanatum TaxID=34168 RepID=A0ACC2DNE4_DIPCM|nr:hypothetical protein O6H91_05G056100 [Diphasiastrum complanatum]